MAGEGGRAIFLTAGGTDGDGLPALSARARRRLFARSVVVGLGSGLLALLFRLILERANDGRDGAMAAAGRLGAWGLALAAFGSAVVVGLGVVLVRRAAPEAAGSGIPHVEAVIHHGRLFRWARVVWVKAVAGAMGLGGGLALGREGPTVQMGAAAGFAGGSALGADLQERRTLTAVGAGAGLAAAFNAPLAGMTFVFEELRAGRRPGDYLAALLATSIADALTRWSLGQGPVFGALDLRVPSLGLLWVALLIGVGGGLLGPLFNAGLFGAIGMFDRMRARLGAWMPAALLGAGVGMLGWWRPELLGGGNHLIDGALQGGIVAIGPALLVLGIRTVLTLGSYATGSAGGLFTPMLVLGAYAGGICAGLHGGEADAPAILVVLGMAAFFTGSIRAPVTGVLLMVEMTGSYALILLLLATCLTAEFVAGEVGGKPIYASLLERDLKRE